MMRRNNLFNYIDMALKNYLKRQESDAVIDDYGQHNFDFTKLLEFIFLLQSNAGVTKFLQNAFGPSSAEAKSFSAEVSGLPTAEAVGKSYDKDKKEKVNRLRVRQFWREKDAKVKYYLCFYNPDYLTAKSRAEDLKIFPARLFWRSVYCATRNR